MADGTAQNQLDRILHILPRAGRPGGATYQELAEALAVTRDQVVRDVEEVTAREYYHPAGSATDVRVGLSEDRVSVWTSGQFERPARLTLREAAALHLGMSLLGAERDDPELLAALEDVENRLTWAGADKAAKETASTIMVTGDPGATDALRALVAEAAKERRRCRLEYLKPDAPEPEPRTVDPYLVAYSDGAWYLIGHCRDRGEPRVFRVDRIMEAERLDDPFEPPPDFDPADYLSDYVSDGRIFRADDEIEVEVRYGARVARWLIERGEGEAAEDGSVVVRHAVADPGWVVRHVLQYGADAEVLGPPEVRAMVRNAAEGIARTGG